VSPLEKGFPLDDEELRLLGELVAYSGLLETVTEGIICRLTSADWHTVKPLVSGQSFTWMLDRIGVLRDRVPGGLGSEFDAWAARAREAMKDRNDCVHAAWLMRSSEPDFAVGYRSKRKAGADEFLFWTPGHLTAVRDKLVDAYNTGRTVAQKLFYGGVDPVATFDRSGR
jgi:hypothetical protein